MSTYDRGVKIIAEVVEKHRDEDPRKLAERCMDAVYDERLVLRQTRASEELFRRFHSHCRFLGDITGIGYRRLYNEAIEAAVKTHDWPMKIYPRRVRLDSGDILEVDVPIPESTTKATTSQLMVAYQTIQDEARRRGIELPENK